VQKPRHHFLETPLRSALRTVRQCSSRNYWTLDQLPRLRMVRNGLRRKEVAYLEGQDFLKGVAINPARLDPLVQHGPQAQRRLAEYPSLFIRR
jgi:hypothetical protein